MSSTPSIKVKSPAKLAHVVIRTPNLEIMKDFYIKCLGAKVCHENPMISFLRYDDEHHRIALFQAPGTGPKNPQTAGLEHIAFSYDTLDDLALAYRQRKAAGILPTWCVNHGPTTSIYYTDPDGNQIETQTDNFNTIEEADVFITSELFAMNPIGTDFDPDDLVRRLESGESHESIKKRIEIGPRLPPGV
jgi:catechol-2,3-dioxygenase